MLKKELDDQVGTRSYTQQTLMMRDTHLESPYGYVTYVSLELLEDGPYVGMRKGITYFPMPWMIFPWNTMMKPYALVMRGALFFAELVGVVWDLMLEGSNAHDKGGM